MARSGVVNVYIKDISSRASWIFKLIIEDLLGQQLVLTKDVSVVNSGEYPSINYSTKSLPGIPTITPAGLLSETGLSDQNISVSEYEGFPVFYNVEEGDLPFDPFSMAFYLVSRYEEYLPFEADKHGRFSYTSSLAFKNDFLGIALVNRLAQTIGDLLKKHYPDILFQTGEYQFIPTIDIDIAFAHLGKGLVRTYGAMAKLLMKGDITEIRSRIKTMKGRTKDPYDNFMFINEVCEEYSLRPLYFVLAGDRGCYDRNLSPKNKDFAYLLMELDNLGELGVHPSYGSNNDPQKLKKEINRIQSVTGNTITKSRQHYVRLSFPDTYSMLIENIIKEDYSMGYADISGFRASIASPYKYYNLLEEKETSLIVYPFMFMDSTLSDYLGLKPDEYEDAVSPIIEEVKACKGTLIGIWHNYALSDDDEKHEAFKAIIKRSATI